MFRSIFKNLELHRIDAFTPLFYAGDNGDRFYIVLEGEVAICVPRTQEEIINIREIPYEEVKFFSLKKNFY